MRPDNVGHGRVARSTCAPAAAVSLIIPAPGAGRDLSYGKVAALSMLR